MKELKGITAVELAALGLHLTECLIAELEEAEEEETANA